MQLRLSVLSETVVVCAFTYNVTCFVINASYARSLGKQMDSLSASCSSQMRKRDISGIGNFCYFHCSGCIFVFHLCVFIEVFFLTNMIIEKKMFLHPSHIKIYELCGKKGIG